MNTIVRPIAADFDVGLAARAMQHLRRALPVVVAALAFAALYAGVVIVRTAVFARTTPSIAVAIDRAEQLLGVLQ